MKYDEHSSMIPVIISGHGDVMDKVKVFNAEAVDYITKPFNRAEVLSRIKKHMDLRCFQKQLEQQNIQLHQEDDSLCQAENVYKNIFENAQEGIFQLTLAGRFIIANRALASMLNYNSAEDLINAVNNALSQLYVNPDDYESLKQMIKEYGPVKGFETQFYQSDERIIWVSLNMHNVINTDGQILYYEGTAKDITSEKKADEERKRNIELLRKALGATVNAMATVTEKWDPYTSGHQQRVSRLARAIATEMGLSHDRIDGLHIAGLIHDIGKIFVPAEILRKMAKLAEMEFGLIKIHSIAGYNILKEIEFPWPVAEIVLQHHERLDGSGYPQGLKNSEILLEAKILCVADVVEAMASHRHHRPALGMEAIFEEISKNKGTIYDPDTVSACMRLFHEKGYKIGC